MGLQLGGIWVFPIIKITVIRQVCMYCDLNVKINTCEMPQGMQRSWTHFACICVVSKIQNTPTGAPWLTMTLHEVVKEFWDLLSISVVNKQFVNKPENSVLSPWTNFRYEPCTQTIIFTRSQCNNMMPPVSLKVVSLCH